MKVLFIWRTNKKELINQPLVTSKEICWIYYALLCFVVATQDDHVFKKILNYCKNVIIPKVSLKLTYFVKTKIYLSLYFVILKLDEKKMFLSS